MRNCFLAIFSPIFFFLILSKKTKFPNTKPFAAINFALKIVRKLDQAGLNVGTNDNQCSKQSTKFSNGLGTITAITLHDYQQLIIRCDYVFLNFTVVTRKLL